MKQKSSKEDRIKAEEYLAKGREYAEEGEFGKAINCYDRAIELDPNNFDILLNKALAYKNLGMHDKAKECFKSVPLRYFLIDTLSTLSGCIVAIVFIGIGLLLWTWPGSGILTFLVSLLFFVFGLYMLGLAVKILINRIIIYISLKRL